MSKNRSTPKKTKKIVRTPATKFAHLQKRIRKRALRHAPKTKPSTKTS